eukprot:5910865-Prymnesium_polylepis.1
MMRPGAVPGATRALQCLWHEVRVDERTVSLTDPETWLTDPARAASRPARVPTRPSPSAQGCR